VSVNRKKYCKQDVQAEFSGECEAVERLSDHGDSDSDQRTAVGGHYLTSHHRHLTTMYIHTGGLTAYFLLLPPPTRLCFQPRYT